MKRRFFSTLPEFRSISYTQINSVSLVCLTSDGKALFLLCTLQGSLRLLYKHNDDSNGIDCKLTAIKVIKGNRVVVGTFEGKIKIIDLSTGKELIENQKAVPIGPISTHPILQIATENIFVDSAGKLFDSEQLILNDGILQPCGLFIDDTDQSIYLVKFRSIYRYSCRNEQDQEQRKEQRKKTQQDLNEPSLPRKLQLQKFTLEPSVNGYFCASELFIDDRVSLVAATDYGELFILKNTPTWSLQKLSPIKPLQLSQVDCELDNSSNTDSENDSDVVPESDNHNETENDTNILSKLEQFQVFGLIKHPSQPNNNSFIILNVNSLQKRANLEVVRLDLDSNAVDSNSNTPQQDQIKFPLAKIICPLCSTASAAQTLSLDAFTCLQGHPITICSLSSTLIPSITSFRCRSCQAAYSPSFDPISCRFCSGLLTKIN